MRLRDYVVRRLLLIIPVLIGVTVITFALVYMVPGDPARQLLGPRTTAQQVEALREQMGLNKPLYIQYGRYLSRLLHGDLGKSTLTLQPVAQDLIERFPATFELAMISMILALIVSIPLGIVSATKRNRPVDHASRIFALTGVSMPIFWLGLMLLLVFYYNLHWAPSPMGRISMAVSPPTHITGLFILDSLLTGNWEALSSSLSHIVLPAICLMTPTLAMVTRMMRSSMLEVLGQDYVKTARAKGLAEKTVIYKHAARNALLPTTTIVGLQFGIMFAGAVLTETIFAWPGMGRYAVEAIMYHDNAGIMGFTLVVALIFILVNLIVDLLYGVLDPRVRYG